MTSTQIHVLPRKRKLRAQRTAFAALGSCLRRSTAFRWATFIALVTISALPATAQRNEAADRAEIHALLMAYGSTLDHRDFDGFGKLFGTDGVYAGGGGREAKGPAAGEMMRQVFASNPSGVAEPNFHLFYNEVVTFDGPDRARATSMSLWMVPDEKKRPMPLLAARYEDELVRKNGQWLFAKRAVKPITNAPVK